MKFKGLKTIAAVTAVSAGVLFAGANSANASTRVTVKPGDTISELAKTYNVSMQSIKDANKIQDINKIYVGEVFEIGDGEVQVVSPAPAAQASVAATTPENTVSAQPAVAPVDTSADQVAAPAAVEAPIATPAAQAPVEAAPATTPAQSASVDEPAAQKPAAVEAPVATPAPVVPAPVSQPTVQAQPVAATTQPAPAQTSAPAVSSVSGNDAAAKAWIAARESSGSYDARNGQYIGKYQLSDSYLNGDYSPANQEAVADNYVTSRYGSWSGAQSFWQSHGWY